MTRSNLQQHGTIGEALAAAARRHAGREVAIADRRGRRRERRTYADLVGAARAMAGRLAAAGVRPGDRLVVSLPTSWAWIDTWCGAVLLGALPVATAPAGLLGTGEEHLRGLASTLELVGARALVAVERVVRALAERPELAQGARLLTPDDLGPEAATAPVAPPEPDPGAVAFLQLTSGTEGRQRAVAIRHRNLLHNVGAIIDAIAGPLGKSVEESDARVVSWLPLYHDMGLVGSLLAALLHGIEIELLPPEAFLGRPRLWLEAMSGRPDVVATAPNFGYQFCAETVGDEEAADLELGGWVAALVGAEMVRTDSLRAFADRFAARGFDWRRFRPCYGLAEGTLAVTVDLVAEGPRLAAVPGGGGEEVVCLGAPIADTRVTIAAPDGHELAEDRIGEVLVAGPGLFAGYHGDPASTADALDAGRLRTGDLGFLHRGELYLTGRIKELLIVRGQNLMPHDLERLAEEVTGGGGARRAAAFSVARGPAGEEVVIVAEAPTGRERGLAELADRIRERIGEALALPVADVAFVAAGRLPRTTSGKIRRQELKRSYLEGELARLED